jgi:hypothetical protein
MFLACVEPFDLKILTSTPLLIVDGKLDDSNGDQYISLKKFIPSANSSVVYEPETGARVTVIKDDKEVIECRDGGNGLYYLPLTFKAEVGSGYQLKISRKDGSDYVSDKELMRSTPEITGYTVKFDPEGIVQGDNRIPAHLVYLNTKDPKENGDNFMWSWKLYEKQNVCKSCFGGIYLTSPAPLGKCLTMAALLENSIEYDYRCDRNCWEIINSDELNVMSDVFSNGNEIKNRLIAKVPYYQSSGFLIEIKQQVVSSSAFQYLKILINQTQNNGTLVDSPPAALIGNIRSVKNPKEAVGGYFMVGNSKVRRIWVDRLDAIGSKQKYLLGRKENFEPSSNDTSRPPLAPCIISNTRTPLKPEGWPL